MVTVQPHMSLTSREVQCYMSLSGAATGVDLASFPDLSLSPVCDHHHVKTILHNETGGGEDMGMRLYRSMVLVPLHALLNITQYSTIAISR